MISVISNIVSWVIFPYIPNYAHGSSMIYFLYLVILENFIS